MAHTAVFVDQTSMPIVRENPNFSLISLPMRRQRFFEYYSSRMRVLKATLPLNSVPACSLGLLRGGV